MARKLGDVVIGLIILAFTIAGVSAFFTQADLITGLDSGIVADSFQNFSDETRSVAEFESGIVEKTDESSTFTLEKDNQQIETRGSDTAGFMNLISKNIIVRLINQIVLRAPETTIVWGLILALVGATISILFIRFFWGENKI